MQGAAGFAERFWAGKQNKMGPKEEKDDWEHLILPGSHNLIFFPTPSPCPISQRGLPRPGAESLGDGKTRDVCVPGEWGEEEGERWRNRDTGFWSPAKKNS